MIKVWKNISIETFMITDIYLPKSRFIISKVTIVDSCNQKLVSVSVFLFLLQTKQGNSI